ncbi:HNH endonuclease [Micractinium conductrix]|uniref:HNH endonuclease n=1 Tax=Micractinium conductrix TaxID=554055 RepID=A0A2P6V9E6_9CHLO|nr:HNH endonuclease [Micractinium conductrix]|eukprot:PSC70708.1 HNH endonuclease [Micractinium conductrix]
MEKAEVLEYYEDASVRTVQLEYFLPAVLRVRRSRPYKRHDRVALNRHNVLLRDGFACQYCGSGRDLTLDHVVPQSRGGPNSWENLVACCSPCNSKKGDKSLSQLRWKLRQHPKEPSPHEMEFLLSTVLGGSAAGLESLPTQWTNYIVPFTSKSSRKAKQAAREAEQEAMEMAG